MEGADLPAVLAGHLSMQVLSSLLDVFRALCNFRSRGFLVFYDSESAIFAGRSGRFS